MRILYFIILFSCYGSLVMGQNNVLPDSGKTSGQRDKFSSRATIDSSRIRKDSLASDTSQPRDTAVKQKAPKPPFIHQFRFGADVSRIAFNLMYPSRQAYGFQADYALRKDVYLVAETGFGSGKVDYDNLKYTTTGYFFRAGVNKSFLDRLGLKDFDIGFLGARYGIGIGRRNQAIFFVPSPFGGGSSGTSPGQDFIVHWGQLVGGVKVEIWKGLF
jgi:hypothetical protein